MNFIKKTAISTAAALTATAATVAVKAKKDKDYCPLCEAKKLIKSIDGVSAVLITNDYETITIE